MTGYNIFGPALARDRARGTGSNYPGLTGLRPFPERGFDFWLHLDAPEGSTDLSALAPVLNAARWGFSFFRRMGGVEVKQVEVGVICQHVGFPGPKRSQPGRSPYGGGSKGNPVRFLSTPIGGTGLTGLF